MSALALIPTLFFLNRHSLLSDIHQVPIVLYRQS
nr:MAG TPA: hypothetical protein [Caudoviricetes sp.]